MQVIDLESIDNVRDLGGMELAEGRCLRERSLLRGSALSGLSAYDQHILFDQIGVEQVIDLRCGWEREAKPNVDVRGVDQAHIPFYDRDVVGIEYSEPGQGAKVIGRDAACDPRRFYPSLANARTVRQMREALHLVFACLCAGRTVYVHCSGGKDRSGVLCALVLTALGATDEAIMEDYLFTNRSRDEKHAQLLAHFMRFSDGDATQAEQMVQQHRAHAAYLELFWHAVGTAYGSKRAFIQEELGVDGNLRATVLAACSECMPQALSA